MDIILETPGTHVGKRKEMLNIKVPDKKTVEVPLREIESIVVGNGIQITTQALQTLSSYAINIIYTSLGKPFGIYTPFANVGTVYTRRQQLMAYEDWRGHHLTIKFVYAAMENKRRLLLYLAKNRKRSNPQKAIRLKAGARKIGSLIEVLLKSSKANGKNKKLSNVRTKLMGLEGRAAAIYFLEYGNLFTKELWMLHRTRRPPRDPINSLLSLGYTVLQGYITTAIAAAGLELYGGFLHSDRSGKPSLALDLLEEFRQPVIDKLITRLIFKGQIKVDDFENSLHGYRLKENKKNFFYSELRKEIIGGDEPEILFENAEYNSTKRRKRKFNYKMEMIRQARKVANYLIGAKSEYTPFIMDW